MSDEVLNIEGLSADEPQRAVPATDPNEVFDDDGDLETGVDGGVLLGEGVDGVLGSGTGDAEAPGSGADRLGGGADDANPEPEAASVAHSSEAAPARPKAEEQEEKGGIAAAWRKKRDEESPLVRVLRRKFIISAMLAVGLVVIALVAFVDIASWYQGVTLADTQLQALAENGGSFERLVKDGTFSDADQFDGSQRHGVSAGQNAATSKQGLNESGGDPEADLPTDAPRGIFGDRGPRDLGLFGVEGLQDSRGMTKEMPYQMRFFSVTLDADGEVLFTDTTRIALVDDEGAADLALEVAQKGSEKGSIENYRYLVVDADDPALGEGTKKYLFLDRSYDLVQLRSLVFASVGVAAVGLVAVFILVVIFSRHVVEPIAESYKRQRRFITDASHDLKTPVAIISSDVEVIELLDGPSEWTGSIRNQVTRLTNLTEKLVMLSSMDEGADAVTKIDFNLEATIEDTVREYAAQAKMSGKTIKSSIEPRLTCHGDAILIDQALNLLLDNAIKYSSEGAQIDVSARHERGKVAIRVSNPVDEMTPGDHSELFERFTRADSSRTSSSGGNGIGLAVVKAIAEAHGGSASAKCKDGKSIEFVVRV